VVLTGAAVAEPDNRRLVRSVAHGSHGCRT